MGFNKEFYEKFPSVLAKKLINKDICFPPGTAIQYEKIHAYRVIERESNDFHSVDRNDFRSYHELNKKPKVPKGMSKKELESNPRYFGVSLFIDKRVAEQKRLFLKPGRKIAEGYVYQGAGPELTEDKHICWWLYDNTDITGFKIEG